MIRIRPCHLFLLVVSLGTDESQAADYYAAADDGYYNAAADDGGNAYYAAADDGGNAYYAAADDGAADDGGGYGYGGDDYAIPDDYIGDDYIKYWTEYAVLPKKCISYNNVDMIVFSLYEQAYQHCMDKPVGTYMTPVPTFVTAYVNQLDANAEDNGAADDYVSPYSDFINCYQYETASGLYYAQLGCTDGDSQSLSVGLFSDATCETPDKDSDGVDDLNFDVSALQVPFKECKQCVNFVDKNEDDVDDQYFENKMINAPLCSTIWANKSNCDRKCKRLGFDASADGWNSSDQVLLGVLGVFSAIMLAVILKKRQKMSNKDALIEEAALGAIGLQQSHIIGIFVLVLVIVAIFAFFRMKAITWGLLLIINTIIFGYLMKLTITSGLAARPVGPDGQLIEREDSSSEEDDDDDEDDDEEDKAEYQSPQVPPIT